MKISRFAFRICDFLCVSNSNLPPILHRFQVLEATYIDHLKLIGKRVVDFLLVSIELFR